LQDKKRQSDYNNRRFAFLTFLNISPICITKVFLGEIKWRASVINMKDTSNKLLEEKLEQIALKLEKMKIAEYIELLNNPKRLLWVNFIAGLARGLGTAIGLTILFAIVLYILQRLILLNLPLISDFIAYLIQLVKANT
jgi:hypothetical protein